MSLDIATKLIVLIKKGDLDDYFEEISEALIARKRRLGRDLFRELKAGDKVQISDNIKPRYMAGQKGVVRAKRQSKVEVEFEKPMGRFGRIVIVPVTSLTLLP